MIPAALDMALTDLAEVVQRISGSLGDIDVCELEDRAAVLAALRGCRTHLAQLESSAETAVVRDLPGKRVEIPGVGVLERKGGLLRKEWDNRKVAFAVCEPIMVDTDTGEVVPEVRDIVNRVVDELLEVAHIDYHRTGALRERGLDPADFCEQTRGRATIQITPLATDAPVAAA